MVNKIEDFLNTNFSKVGAVKLGDVIWFVASDVAKALGYATTQKVTEKVDDDDKDYRTWLTLGGKQKVLTINESGLYQVIFSISKKDEERYSKSRDFKRWITGEVIPTLRETGAYIEKEREQEVVDKYFNGLSEDLKLQVFKELQTNNEKLQVKAGKFDKFLDVGTTHTFTEVAKMLSTKANEEYSNKFKISGIALTKYLRDKQILCKKKNGKSFANLPNQKYEQYFDVVSRTVNEEINKTQTRVKTSGIEMIYDVLVLDGFELN